MTPLTPSLVGWLMAMVGFLGCPCDPGGFGGVPVTPLTPSLSPQRRLSADVPPSLVGWLTAVVGLRLQAVLEQMPVTPEQVLPYVRHLGEPPEPPPRQVTPPRGVTAPMGHKPHPHRVGSTPSLKPRPPLNPAHSRCPRSQWRCRRRSRPQRMPRYGWVGGAWGEGGAPGEAGPPRADPAPELSPPPSQRDGAGSPAPATTAEEALPPPESDSEAWAAAVPPVSDPGVTACV